MQQNYASVSTRIRAVIIDGIALMILIYSATQLFEAIGQVPNVVRISTFILLFLLYEPILVSFFGATIGHFFNDIVVKRQSDETKNLNLIQAVIRYVIKDLLGWVSLLSISSSEKRQAIHDSAVGSIVKVYEKIIIKNKRFK